MRRSRLLVRSAYHRAIPLTLRRRVNPSIYRRLMQLEYSLDGNLRSMPQRLRGLKDKYRGQRCFIMGNGPSLNQTPLDKLNNDFVWGLNRCSLLFDRITWRPAFYTAVDTLVVPDIASEINSLTKDLPETLFFFPVHFYTNGTLRSRDNTIWFRPMPMDAPKGPSGFFSLDAANGIRDPHTVTITALQLSVWMGFDPIYLIGCDMTYAIPAGVQRKGEAVDPGTGDKISGFDIVSTSDNDPNHFDPRYFGTGSKWHAPNTQGMLFGYRMAKMACDSKGISILNATIGGALEVFPRVDYEELF